MKRFIAIALIIAGLVLAVMSFFDSGVEKPVNRDGTSALTQKVCSDYPQNAQPADCVNSEDTLNKNGGIDHPLVFGFGIALLALGVYLFVHQPSVVATKSKAEWKCRVDGQWNPIDAASCMRCGNARVGSDEVRGNKPGDTWPNAPFSGGGAA